MKKIISLSLASVVLTGSLFAGFQNKQKLRDMDIEQAKSHILSNIDKRMDRLSDSKSCVEKATTKEELRECKPKRDKRKGKGNKNGYGERKGGGMKNQLQSPPMPPEM